MARMLDFSGKVLLLGNYANDRQESMQRFSTLMMEQLSARSLDVDLLRPEPVLGRIFSGPGGVGKWLGYVDKFIFFPKRLAHRLRQFRRDEVLHICDHSNSVYVRHVSQTPHLVTCHDLLAIRSALGEIPENRTAFSGRVYQKMIRTGLNRARRVACVSKSTQKDLTRLTILDPSQMSLVYNGLNYPYRPMECAEARRRIGRNIERPPERFILHVGGNQWYKNRLGVVRVYVALAKLLPNAPALILAGKPWTLSLRKEIEKSGLASRIIEAVDLDNEDLRALYSTADALLFPSLMEGFGWPIIEAQACGCRVATSNRAPMSEIGGNAAVYFDPADIASAARLVGDLISEPAPSREQRRRACFANASSFSVDQMIDRYIEEYALVCKSS